jgi:hypothetical protein
VPDDASELTRCAISYWSSDGHSHGHCSLDTFVDRWFATAGCDFRAWVVRQRLDRPYFTLTEHLFGYIETDWYEYRVVFWFDN